MLTQIDEQIEKLMWDFIHNDCKVGDRDKTGIDPRAFIGTFWYNYDAIIIVKGNERSLNYYGGFEYIDADYIREYGNYVVYSAEADRVQEVLENLMENEDA